MCGLATAANGSQRVVAAGGCDDGVRSLDTVEIFSVEDRKWTRGEKKIKFLSLAQNSKSNLFQVESYPKQYMAPQWCLTSNHSSLWVATHIRRAILIVCFSMKLILTLGLNWLLLYPGRHTLFQL